LQVNADLPPILFVFFDQEIVGNLGSQVWTEYYHIEKYLREENIITLTSIDLSENNWTPYHVSGDNSND
jgi:hypothetical protein